LEERSFELGRLLGAHGVEPGARVGICLPRSPELVASMLAVMRAGAAYLPLDPSYPNERLHFMIADARLGLVLTNRTLGARLGPGARPVYVEDSGAAPGASAPEPELDPDDIAYVIYTSGSTGTPKGVEVPHRGLANLVAWHNETYRVSDEDRASHLAALGFDASVWEMWPPLCAGASLHLADDEHRTDPERLQ